MKQNLIGPDFPIEYAAQLRLDSKTMADFASQPPEVRHYLLTKGYGIDKHTEMRTFDANTLTEFQMFQ